MHSKASLLDIHERSHRSLAKLLEHCRSLSADDLQRRLEGFGEATVPLQLHHVIAAEQYWIGVLQGRMETDDTSAAYPTIDALEAFRQQIAAQTVAYLQAASDEELNTARPMVTYGGKQVELQPAHVVLRPLMHIYHHQGQVLAMCRLLGKPGSGMDFPLA
ncbi:MAG: DinB family protein [Planctomycetes bacterium]|nr:DinB family protein [Planctomycetota bacterium]MCB9912894.1 DinB family protein [Planctomycetota bacterium]HPF14537.1 DinB family protein [Planctomycetota bacterium]